jgi:hypothetical protein
MTDSESSYGLLRGYLSDEAVARELDVGVRTLQRWRYQRKAPAVTFVGRAPYYRIESFQAWLLSRENPVPEKNFKRRDDTWRGGRSA